MKTTLSASQSPMYLYPRTPQDMVPDLYDYLGFENMKLNRDMENLRNLTILSNEYNKYILVAAQ